VEDDAVTGATTTRRCGRLVALLLTAGLALSVAGSEPGDLGRAYDVDPDGHGLLETRGRALADGEVVRALNHPALVRLDNGRVLELAANSSASFEAGPGGTIEVAVLSGRAVVVGASGRPLVAGCGSRFSLRPALRDVVADENRLLEFDLGGPLRREEAEESPGRIRFGGGARR
jgi:hypothetical protein